MLDFCRRRLTWPVLLELLVFCEMEDEADMDDPLKKEDEFTVELILRGVTFSMGERPMMDEWFRDEANELLEDELKEREAGVEQELLLWRMLFFCPLLIRIACRSVSGE